MKRYKKWPKDKIIEINFTKWDGFVKWNWNIDLSFISITKALLTVNNYKNTKFEEFINISGKGNDGKGMPFATFFRNIDIVQAYDTKSIISSCKKFLGITMPDFTKIKANPPAPIHHKFGCQFVMMNYSVLDANMMYYLNLFNKKGTSFVLKDETLRYKSRKISKPENQDPKLSFGPQQMQLLGGAYTPSL